MKDANRITHFASRSDYLQKKSVSQGLKKGAEAVNKLKDKANAAAGTPEKSLKAETKKAAKHLKEDAISSAKNSGMLNSISSFLGGLFSSTPSIPSLKINPQVKHVQPAEKVIQRANDSLSPGIYMLTGFSFGGLSDDDSGLPEMAKHIPGAKIFPWDQEENVLKEIAELNKDAAVILVGHSLGGDAVVNMANKLNSLEHGFRKVDLLVTLDAVGFDNDIIPKNVQKNLNFIGDKDRLFNDGPNIPRSGKDTQVINELRSEGHRGLDDSADVQFKIFHGIKGVLKSHQNKMDLENEQRGRQLVAMDALKMIEQAHKSPNVRL